MTTPSKANELARAVALATRVLDRPNADPDDDLAVLSRQLLRAIEGRECCGHQGCCDPAGTERYHLCAVEGVKE